MFSNQPKFKPKTLAKPKIRTVSVEVPTKPRTPVNGTRVSSTAQTPRGAPQAGTPTSAFGVKRSADGRPRASNSPLTSSDKRGSLSAPPTNGRKRIRSPTTDSDRVAFESDEDTGDDDDDWESRLKRRKIPTRTDPNRKLRHVALTDLAEGGYRDTGKTLKFIHAVEIVSLQQGDKPSFAHENADDLVLELQYPGSLTRERYELACGKDKLDVVKDIIRVVQNVKETYITDEQDRSDFDRIIRQLQRNSNDKILNLAGFKTAVDTYNETLLRLLKNGTIVANIDRQHELPNNLVALILNQVYDRVVTPKVDILKRYDNGTDNVYGEMQHIFIHQALSKKTRMTLDQVFVDLGSGVGNVVLQAALEIGCESWGCEMMEGPAMLAKAQHQEFRARCKLWGIQPGRVRLIQADFTQHQEINDVLKRADVVIANNKAFTSQLNDKLKTMFLDLKPGCKVISLNSFVPPPSTYSINDIGSQIFDNQQCRWPEKGVSWTDSSGDYYVATKKE